MYLGSNYLGKTYRNLLFALKLVLRIVALEVA